MVQNEMVLSVGDWVQFILPGGREGRFGIVDRFEEGVAWVRVDAGHWIKEEPENLFRLTTDEILRKVNGETHWRFPR